MSADDFSYSSSAAQQQAFSPKRRTRNAPNTVPPQPVNDRTLLDSVTGFINDVTQASGNSSFDPKETIQWARFETSADPCDPTIGDDWDVEGGVAPPLLLVLGYGSGVQCWAIPANGEAVEVLSWRHGSVRTLRLLPHPLPPTAGVLATEIDPESVDKFAEQRPLMAICDASAASPAPFCSVNFVSLRGGDTIKSIKFKTPILDIVANRSAVVISFSDRVAVFDARTLEDRMTVTTCHPGVSVSPNPVALGSRWMAYAERKLIPAKRSCGGCEGDGVASYTATVLNAAKSIGKGLRDLGGQMAAGFGGSSTGYGGYPQNGNGVAPDDLQPGIVTIMDIKHPIKDNSPTTGAPVTATGADPIVAHFVAHSEAIIALDFDFSGMLLATADKRGHDFHVFRIQPHPGGPSLSAVHHLYVLHRGDTTAKVQGITFSLDSRWIAVSTLRGTTHVFPVTPYGGAAGVRTHGSPHVVNRLSRFHRSAGLSVDGVRSASPVHSAGGGSSSHQPGGGNCLSNAYSNPRISPFPQPTIVLPLAQLRQPSQLNPPLGSSNNMQNGSGGSSSRPRMASLTDDSKPLRVCTTFAKARAWLLEPPGGGRDIPSMRLQQRKAVDSLFVMASHGALIQYDLDPKTNSAISKDRICDDTAIELDVEPRAQWNLQRRDGSTEIEAPLPAESWLLKDRLADSVDANTNSLNAVDKDGSGDNGGSEADRTLNDQWLSQVEIITHAGPHRRLWMGPQFMFKTYNAPSGGPLSLADLEAVEVGVGTGACNRPARSNPVNMPTPGGGRPNVEVLIESGSFEHSPRMSQHRDEMGSDLSLSNGEIQLREDLADAMRESPGRNSRNSTGLAGTCGQSAKFQSPSASSPTYTSIHHAPQRTLSIAKVVNPLGTVTTTHRQIVDGQDVEDEFDDFLFNGDAFIHENCDEALFRPVVAVFGSTGRIGDGRTGSDARAEAPADIGQSFVVPVIELKQTGVAALSKVPPKTTKPLTVTESSPKVVDFVKPVGKERKKSDTKPPTAAIGKEVVVLPKKESPPDGPAVVKPKEAEVTLSKASKKAQKKAAAAAAKLLERVPENQEQQQKNNSKNRRNSSQKVEVEIHPEPVAHDYDDEMDSNQSVFVRNLNTSIAVPLSDVICSAPLTSMNFADMMKALDTTVTLPDIDDEFFVAGDDQRFAEPDDYLPPPPPVYQIHDRIDHQPVPAVRSTKLNKNAEPKGLDEDTLTVIECFEQEYSSIQDSIFVDPVVTSTVVVKKSGRKSKMAPPALISTSPIEDQQSTADTDSGELEFVDAFAPLELFELHFEHLGLSKSASEEQLDRNAEVDDEAVAEDFVSLINFISPLQEHADRSILDVENAEPDNVEEVTTQDRSPFEHCVDFVVQSIDDDVVVCDDPPVLLYECQDSDYRSLEQEIDASFQSIDQPTTHEYKDTATSSMPNSQSTSSSASSGEESSSQLTTTTTITAPASSSAHYKPTDDEELQPLISRSSHNMSASQDNPAQYTLTAGSATRPASTPLDACPADAGDGHHSSRDRDVELGEMPPPTAEQQQQPAIKMVSAAGRNAKKSKKKRR